MNYLKHYYTTNRVVIPEMKQQRKSICPENKGSFLGYCNQYSL